MAYLLGALAVFWLWTLAQTWVSAPEWFWYVFITVLSLASGYAVDHDKWYWGFGIAGLTFLTRRLDDLLLLLADRARLDVLRATKR